MYLWSSQIKELNEFFVVNDTLMLCPAKAIWSRDTKQLCFCAIFFLSSFLSGSLWRGLTFEAFCCDMFLALFFFNERQNSCPLGSTKKP
jgi:hypothetical protein